MTSKFKKIVNIFIMNQKLSQPTFIKKCLVFKANVIFSGFLFSCFKEGVAVVFF